MFGPTPDFIERTVRSFGVSAEGKVVSASTVACETGHPLTGRGDSCRWKRQDGEGAGEIDTETNFPRWWTRRSSSPNLWSKLSKEWWYDRWKMKFWSKFYSVCTIQLSRHLPLEVYWGCYGRGGDGENPTIQRGIEMAKTHIIMVLCCCCCCCCCCWWWWCYYYYFLR